MEGYRLSGPSSDCSWRKAVVRGSVAVGLLGTSMQNVCNTPILSF
jgi:hypothetical protein